MCLITRQKEPIILKEDLVVYKILSKYLKSPYEHFQYEINKLYKTKLTFDISVGVPAFDDICSNYLRENGFQNWFNNKLEDLGLNGVVEGYHSALTKERLKNSLCSGECIFECLIPKGSEVYYDDTGLVVSDQLIIK